MVKTYSLKQDGAAKLSEHFRVREFAEAGTDRVLVDEELVERLEALRARLDCTKIIITCGFRTDSTTSQHAKGKAADVNCWHKENGEEVRYQGKEILLAAEDVGFRGIGWIPGSAQSRAAVHLDTRENTYFFDEANGNRSIGDSWYTFFGLAKPGAPTGNPYAEPTALLKKGSRGDGVKWVQWELERRGYDLGSGGVDGIFGDKTDAGVRAVQRAAEIKVDGIVGPDTRGALKADGEAGTPPQTATYTVKAGDNLSRIGSKLGVPWREIAQANGIEEPWIIRPGQVLVIPEG